MSKDFNHQSANKNNINVVCPHCNKTGNMPIMRRWHFDNCKSNPNFVPKVRKPRNTGESDMSHDPLFNPFKEGTWWHEHFFETHIKQIIEALKK
jgi:hypothetical protein